MKNKQELENSINHLTCVLNTLKDKVDESDDYNKAYNRLLVERAKLRQKLCQRGAGKIISLFKDNLHSLRFNNKEKRICDYFSSIKING